MTRVAFVAALLLAMSACFTRPELLPIDGGVSDGNDDGADADDAAGCTGAVDPLDPQLVQLELAHVSAGTFHVCAIDTTMAMWCWGSNDHGQLGVRTDSPGEQTGKPGLASTITGWTAVSASVDHTCGIANSKVYCWGRNDNHQSLPSDASGNDVIPTEVVLPNLQVAETPQKISAGETASCAITSLNHAYCWGDVNFDGGNDTMLEPELLTSTPDPGWSSIAIATDHACALDINNNIHCWGSNLHKQLGDAGADRTFDNVVLRGGAEAFTSIAVTRDVTCATRSDGDLVCFGTSGAGHFGPVGNTPESDNFLVLDAGTWNRVSISLNHVCVAKATGEVYCYGDNADGALGGGQFASHRNLGNLVDQNAREITTGEGYSCALDASNHLRCWGKNSHGELGLGAVATKRDPSTALLPMGSCESVFQVASGDRHTCAIVGTVPETAGRLYCWGNNGNRQVTGLTSDLAIPKPSEVFPGQLFSRVATGEVHTCALRADGAIRCWGDNSASQLGAGGTSPSELMPIGGMPWIYVAAGSRASCGIRMGGDLFCWGNVPGTNAKPTPFNFGHVNEGSGRGWTSVSIGSGFGLGTAIDPAIANRVFVYGFGGSSCQLAGQTATSPDLPHELYATVHVRANVSAGQANGAHMCIHMNDDSPAINKVTCYGNNSNHQVSAAAATGCLGPEDPPAPASGWRMAFPGLSTVTVSRTHSCALDMIGRPYCWGANNTAELGKLLATTDVPTQVTDQRFAELSTGADHTCGIGEARTSVSCWGENRHGQLGDNARFHAAPTPAALVPP